MKNRLLLVAKAISFYPLSLLFLVLLLPYWIITGKNIYPKWMRDWWDRFDRSYYD